MTAIAIAVLDGQHRYRWANAAFCDLAECDLAHLRREADLSTAADHEDADADNAALAPLHAGRCESVSWRRQFGRRQRRWCVVTAHALRDDVAGLERMVWSVSPEDAAASDPGILQRILQDRLTADRQRLIAVLSHDALQPTRMIASYAGLLGRTERSVPGPSDEAHLAAVVRASSELGALLRETVAYLQAMTNPTSPQGPASLRHAGDAAARNLSTVLPGLDLRCDNDLSVALAEDELVRCLHGAIILTWSRSASRQIRIAGFTADGMQTIEVSAPDAGPFEDDSERTCRIGVRIECRHQANSMLTGLSASRRIAEAVGGSLTIASDGQCLRVTVRIPSAG